MKKTFQEQLKHIRENLGGNITSIKSLLETSHSMAEVMKSLRARTDKDSDAYLIKELSENKDKIDTSIESLLKHTDELFTAYENMASFL